MPRLKIRAPCAKSNPYLHCGRPVINTDKISDSDRMISPKCAHCCTYSKTRNPMPWTTARWSSSFYARGNNLVPFTHLKNNYMAATFRRAPRLPSVGTHYPVRRKNNFTHSSLNSNSFVALRSGPYGASRSYSTHSVGLLLTSDKPDTETFAWQHIALTTDIHALGRFRTCNSST